MSRYLLEKANRLQSKIDGLNSFCFMASQNGFWEKALVEKRIKLITNVNGFVEEKTGLKLDKKTTLDVIDVLKRREKELQKELDGVFNQALEGEE